MRYILLSLERERGNISNTGVLQKRSERQLGLSARATSWLEEGGTQFNPRLHGAVLHASLRFNKIVVEEALFASSYRERGVKRFAQTVKNCSQDAKPHMTMENASSANDINAEWTGFLDSAIAPMLRHGSPLAKLNHIC